MTENNRKYPRLAVPMQIELAYEGADAIELTTRDVSDGGVFLETHTGSKLPEINTRVIIKVIANLQGEEPPSIPGTVVRVTDEGIGIMYDLYLDD